MKLYIPTCTLNFNNIFSSESISPIGFYSHRGFGNKRFYPVCANDKGQAILLFSKYPHFKVDDSNLENYPMVIEINTDDYKPDYFEKVAEHDGVGIYACYQTINLNPFHCAIYFKSYSECNSVLAKAEQSLENKFYKLYLVTYKVESELEKPSSNCSLDLFSQVENNEFIWSPLYANVELKNPLINTETDVTIDRIKGFLYCYLIGANTSVSSEVGKLKLLSRKLCNTFSAVVNSPNHQPTQIQYEAILKGIQEFNRIYSSIDEDSIYNTTVLKSKLEDNPLHLSYDEGEQLLKYWDLFEPFCNNLYLKEVYDANDLWRCLESSTFDSFNCIVESMANAVQKIEDKYIASFEKYSIDSLVQISDNLSVIIIDKSYDHYFYEKLIQSQIKGEYKNIMTDKGVEEPLAQAYNGGALLKDMLGDNWDGSKESKYALSLLDHFQENKPFDLFSIDNVVLTSFAAFCQKGDNIDRLAGYLVQCGFSNYRLAYGIYGATRGFATLPKTFTSILIDGDREYYQIVSKTIWQMLNSIELQDAVLPQPKVNISILSGSKLGTKIIENTNIIEPNIKKQKSIMEVVSKALELEDAVQSPKAFMYILDSFQNIKRTKAFKSLEKINFAEDKGSYTPEQFKEKIYNIIGKNALKGQKKNIDKAIELEAKRQNPDAFLMILDNFMDHSNPAYKQIAALVKSDSLNPSKINAETRSNNYFYKDPNTIKELKDIINDEKILKNIEWFFDDLKKEDNRKYYKDLELTNNKLAIDKFCNKISEEKITKNKIEQIRSHFYKKYDI